MSALPTAALRERFPELVERAVQGEPLLAVPADALHELLSVLRDEHRYDHLSFLTALDRPQDGIIELVYRLYSYGSRAAVTVRASLPRDAASVATVSDLYATADWHERETAELFGITFAGHPDPRRLLTPDGLVGYPLRKDFTHPNLRRLPEAGS